MDGVVSACSNILPTAQFASRSNTMSGLTLSVGSRRLQLTFDDLSRHPNSLLSSLIVSVTSDSIGPATTADLLSDKQPARTDSQGTATSGTTHWLLRADNGWTLDLDAMDVPIKDELKVLDLPAAATLLHAVYKQDVTPQAVWEPLLNSCPKTPSGSEQTKHDRALHDDVFKLLDYFNLPGPVTHWLPSVESLTLQHWRLLGFIYTCHALQSVKTVVDTMMAYKPHQDPKQPGHTAVFAVFCDTAGAKPLASLNVYVFRPYQEHVFGHPYQELLSHVENTTNSLLRGSYGAINDTQQTGYDYGTVLVHDWFHTGLSCVGIDGTIDPNTNGLRDLVHKLGDPIMPSDCDLGLLLTSALSARVRGIRMMFGNILMKAHSCSRPISFWVLRW